MKARPHLPVRPHGELREIFPGVHFVTGTMGMGPFKFSRNMTVLEHEGRLTLVNTVRLDDEGLAALEGLGEVTDVVRIAGYHGSDDAFYKERYGCRVQAVQGQTYFEGIDPKRGEIYFEPDGYLTADSELPYPGASLHIIGSTPPEAIFRIPAGGGTIITGDSLQNWSADRYFNFFTKIAMNLMGFLKPHQLGAGWLKDAQPHHDEVAGILELDFQNVLPGHGEAVLGNAKEKYRPAIEAHVARAR